MIIDDSCDICGLDGKVLEQEFKRMGNDFRLFTMNVKICNRCIEDMLYQFEPKKDYSDHGGVYPF